MTLHIVKLDGIEFAPNCILVPVVPPTNVTGAPAPLPSTVPVVTVPRIECPVLPTHVCPAHLLSNLCVTAFQSDASEVMKGILRASTSSMFVAKLRTSKTSMYVPAAHGEHVLLRVRYPALQVQLLALVLLAGEELNCRHGAHVVLLNLKVPGWQNLHTSKALSRIWSGRQTQLSRDGDPGGDVMPTGHAQHACVARYSLAAQSGVTHGADPCVVLKVSKGHTVHAPPFAPEKPASQPQRLMFGLAAGERELSGHVWHVPGPAPVLYVPASHAEHAAPSLPEYPALQRHAVLIMLAAGDCAFEEHGVQDALPVLALNSFCAHGVHVPPSGPV